jgi:uncharacterized delta-60 repeat protein
MLAAALLATPLLLPGMAHANPLQFPLLDPSFGTQGNAASFAIPGKNVGADAVVVDSSGRMVVAGSTDMWSVPGGGYYIARYLADGTLDNTFGNGGRVVQAAATTTAYDLKIDAVGRVVVVGSADGPSGHGMFVARYTAGGNVDTSFAGGSITDFTTPGPGPSVSGVTALIAADGHVLVVGTGGATTAAKILRYSSAGVLDTTYGVNGVATLTAAGKTFEPYNAVFDAAENVVLFGRAANVPDDGTTPAGYGLGRVTAAGFPDASFGINGMTTDVSRTNWPGAGLRLDATGRILITTRVFPGGGYAGFVVMRYLAGGTIDASFASTGVTATLLPPLPGSFNDLFPVALHLDAAGRIIVSGIEVEGFSTIIQRRSPDGQVDLTFGDSQNGYFRGPANTSTLGSALDGSGRLVTVGSSWTASAGHVAAYQRYLLAPGVPAAPHAVSLSATQTVGDLHVGWAPGFDGGSAISSFTALASPGGLTCSALGAAATGCTISGLAPGTAYTATVTATNSIGASAPSVTSASAAPAAPPADPQVVVDTTPPLPVAALAATGVIASDGTIGARVSWTEPGGNDVAAVRVGVHEGDQPSALASETWASMSLAQTTATLSRLRPGSAYTVSVYAVDAAGNVSSPRTVHLQGSRARVRVNRASTAGDLVGVRAALTDARGKGLASKTVEVLVRPAGSASWRVLRRGRTDARGNIAVAARPATNTSYGLRFAGERGTLGVVPGTAGSVKVAARIATRLSLISPKRANAVRRRGAVTLVGTVAPAKPGKHVFLQVRVGAVWRNVRSARLGAKSTFSFVLPTAARGSASYRVYSPADAANVAGASAVQVLTVL